MSPAFLFIVVIDDSPTVCTLLETVLTREGHRVKSFQNPVLAVRSILKTGELPLPDLLFIDLILPTMSGYEVIKLFRNDPASMRIPIVVISRRSDVVTRLKIRLTGATAYLEKPFQVQDVLACVRSIVAFPNPNTHTK